MAEDWNSIAAEVDEALRSIGDVSQPNGFPVTLRRVTVTGGNGYDPESGVETITYHSFVGIESVREIRDASGTLIGQTKRTITVNATGGVVPHDDEKIALGVSADDADEDSPWESIQAVRPLAPAGVNVLFDIDLQQ